MKIYNYHPVTKEFIGDSIADKSPLESDIYLIPANSTDIQPPDAQANQVAVFEDNDWIIKPDFRGQIVYKKSDLSEIIIQEIGEIPLDMLESLPVKPNEFSAWDGSGYVFDMNLVRTKRNQLLQESDFTQIPDCPLTAEKKEAYRVYRQALRDLPENIDISNPLFPDKPE